MYVGFLCSLCDCKHLKFTDTPNILEILLLASVYYVIYKHNDADNRTSLTT